MQTLPSQGSTDKGTQVRQGIENEYYVQYIESEIRSKAEFSRLQE